MRKLAWLFTAALLLAAPAAADARSEKTVHWTADRIFPTAVRFLRVDAKVKIVEKDAESGYVLFDLDSDGKTFRGALEIVVVTDDPVEVRLILTIDDRPEYMEQSMLDKLELKLKDELGTPPPDKPKPKEETP
jgi:hypothetical protein